MKILAATDGKMTVAYDLNVYGQVRCHPKDTYDPLRGAVYAVLQGYIQGRAAEIDMSIYPRYYLIEAPELEMTWAIAGACRASIWDTSGRLAEEWGQHVTGKIIGQAWSYRQAAGLMGLKNRVYF